MIADNELFIKTKAKIDALMISLEGVNKTNPYLTVIIMHEFARNLYPNDSYIQLDNSVHRMDCIKKNIDEYMNVIEYFKKWGGYNFNFDMFDRSEVKVRTGKVYGKFWNSYAGDMVAEATDFIKKRFESNGFLISNIKNKSILDAGCGSGRYSCALARLGAKKVVGLDYGVDGLNKARELAASNNIENVEFIQGSVLEMPFENETFDFVFHNGVFHHTESLKKATYEMYRVLKKDSYGWYYIYGSGGIFWYARRKMNEFMKNNIPQEYAIKILEYIGMPMNRFIFSDNWYVPIEEHTSKNELEAMFKEVGFSEFARCENGRETDLDYLSIKGSDKDRLMWGDGELRYFVKK